MQRLFSMFPNAGPGVGLVMLRLAVALALADCPGPRWLVPLLMALLGVGLGTPILAVAASALHASRLLAEAGGVPAVAAACATALALAFLGPGAYSLDARRFGRRRVVTQAPADPIE